MKCLSLVEGKHGDQWQPGTSHLVARGPARNNKQVAAMAEGVWLVGPGYVDACLAAGGVMVDPVSS